MFKSLYLKLIAWIILPNLKTSKRKALNRMKECTRSSHAGPGSQAGRASWRAAELFRVKFCSNLFSKMKGGGE